MTDEVTPNPIALRLPRKLIRWVLIPLLCLAGTSGVNAGFDPSDRAQDASIVATDMNVVQDQNDQWDLDTLVPVAFSTSDYRAVAPQVEAVISHGHQILVAFIPRAPPKTSPKPRIFVF